MNKETIIKMLVEMSVRTYGLIELSSQNPEEEYDITEEAEKVYEEFMKPKKETSDGE